jgi:hypothetical protein
MFVANAAHIPAAAMRGLDTRSRMPLGLASAASTTSAGGAALASTSAAGTSWQVKILLEVSLVTQYAQPDASAVWG